MSRNASSTGAVVDATTCGSGAVTFSGTWPARTYGWGNVTDGPSVWTTTTSWGGPTSTGASTGLSTTTTNGRRCTDSRPGSLTGRPR